MSERAPSAEKKLKSPEEAAAQVRRIASKLIERASGLQGSGYYDHPATDSFMVTKEQSTNTNCDGDRIRLGDQLTYNRNTKSGFAGGSIKVRDNGSVKLSRSYQGHGEDVKYDVRTSVNPRDMDAVFEEISGKGSDEVRETVHTDDFDGRHREVSRGGPTSAHNRDEIMSTRSAAARTLADARDQLARRGAVYRKKAGTVSRIKGNALR